MTRLDYKRETGKKDPYPSFEGNDRFMFITHRTPIYTECDEVKMVLEGGCTWIQLRMKEEMDLNTAKAIANICKEHPADCIFCMNDDIEAAFSCGAQAVHVGKSDLPVSLAWELVREQLPGNEIFYIGATANTFEDIQQAVSEGASYIGLGPYRFTETKKKLSPILGIEGYRTIIKQCKKAGILIPIFAIGGICLEDVAPLMETGITGIAVSGAVIHAPDPVEETRRFIHEINKY